MVLTIKDRMLVAKTACFLHHASFVALSRENVSTKCKTQSTSVFPYAFAQKSRVSLTDLAGSTYIFGCSEVCGDASLDKSYKR